MADVPARVAGIPFVQALPDAALAELGRSMRSRHAGRGMVLALSDDPITHLVVVADGRLALSQTTASGREQVLRTFGPGEFLGELALFTSAVHEGDLVALEPLDVCVVSRQAVQELLHRHLDVAVSLVEVLAQRLAQAERRIGDLGLHDVGQRLAGELTRAAAGDGLLVDGIGVRPSMPGAKSLLAWAPGRRV